MKRIEQQQEPQLRENHDHNINEVNAFCNNLWIKHLVSIYEW